MSESQIPLTGSGNAGINNWKLGVGPRQVAVARTGTNEEPGTDEGAIRQRVRKPPETNGHAVPGWRVLPWIGDIFHRKITLENLAWTPRGAKAKTLYSVCGLCESACGIAVEVESGVARKLGGNPFHPGTTEPHARYSMPVGLAKTWPQPHGLCSLGSRGRQVHYDPFRLTVPLKRSGPRGSGQWKVIAWEKLISEVVEGGTLFGEVAGEQSRHVEGFADLFAAGKGQEELADPRDPGLGPKTNGLVIRYAQKENGRTDFLSRFAQAFGTANLEWEGTSRKSGHACPIGESRGGMPRAPEPDVSNATYILDFGLGLIAQDKSSPLMTRKIAVSACAGRLTYRGVAASGSDAGDRSNGVTCLQSGDFGALAMGMVRWIIEHEGYDKHYLSLTSAWSAGKAKSPTFSNASWLVIADPGHSRYGMFLDPRLAGLETSGKRCDATALHGSSGVAIDAHSRLPGRADHVSKGELWPSGMLSLDTIAVNGISCRTGLQMLYSKACELTLTGYADRAGIESEALACLAREFSSHGRRAAAQFRCAPSLCNDQLEACQMIMTLNYLVGSMDWLGGCMTGGGTADYLGEKDGAAYDLTSWPGKPDGHLEDHVISPKLGVSGPLPAIYSSPGSLADLLQHDRFFWDGGGISELPAGAGADSGGRVKIVVYHAGTAVEDPLSALAEGGPQGPLSLGARDIEKVPLSIVIASALSPASAYADYVVPDTSYLESWGFPAIAVPTKAQPIRYPVVEALTARTLSGQPMCMEQFFIDVAKSLALSGFGAHAFSEGGSLDTREDYYLKMVANIAYDPSFMAWKNGKTASLGSVPSGSPDDLKVIGEMRAAHPNSLSHAEWRKAAYVLARGGRFENYEVAYLPSQDSQALLNRMVSELVRDSPRDYKAYTTGQITSASLREIFRNATSLPLSPPENPSWMTYRYGASGFPCPIYHPQPRGHGGKARQGLGYGTPGEEFRELGRNGALPKDGQMRPGAVMMPSTLPDEGAPCYGGSPSRIEGLAVESPKAGSTGAGTALADEGVV